MSGDLISDASATLPDENRLENVFCTLIKSIKKLSFLFVIYILGYFEISIVWAAALLTFLLLKQRWEDEKKTRRDIARAMALGYEREILLNCLPELPSWVNFPDIEKTEWLNKVFKQFWININEYIRDFVPEILEPVVQGYVNDFKFEEVVLGNVPIRVDGVKVYDQDSGNKVVMDLDVSYAGDCYVTFKTFRFTGGIKDIQLHGRLRVVMTPLIDKIPIIGGLQIYFMNEPRIDFDLIKVTSILDIPVIRTRIKNTIMKIVNSMFLFPNVYSIKLGEGVSMSKLTIFKTEGILRVHVVEAKNLVNKDIIGKSDPYTILAIGSVTAQTPVIQNCLNPKWDFWTEFETESNSELKIQIWDRDEGSNDESLGNCKIDISDIAHSGEDDQWVNLQNVATGTIHVRLTWLTLSSDYNDLEAILKENEVLSPQLHSALLEVYLETSEDLPMVRNSPPSCFVELQVERNSKVTDVSHNTCNPMWDKGFTFMIRDPKRAILDVKIKDVEKETEIGDFSYKVDKLKDEPNLEFRHHRFLFNSSASKGSIFCSMKLRIFKNSNVEEEEDEVKDEPPKSPTKGVRKQNSTASHGSKVSQSSFSTESVMSETENSFNFSIDSEKKSDLGNIKLTISYSELRQKLVVIVHEIERIRHKKPSDLPHPYVKLYLQTDKVKANKKKTKTIKSTAHPLFNETFEFLISSRDLNFTKLIVVVASEKGLWQRKKFWGQIAIDLAKCDQLSEPFTDWFNLKRRVDTDIYYLNYTK